MNGDSRPFHAGLATACALIMAGCAAYRQTDSQVVAREPGDRFLGTPKPVQTEAETDWEYAWLSQVAYCKISSVTQAPKGTDKNACVHAEEILEHDGWKGLNIDRIYERHEILAVVRSFTSLFVPPSKADPSIRGVRYNFFGSINPIYDHSILELAEKLQAASDHGHAVEAAK